MILVGVKNGLIELRKLLLRSAWVMFVTAIISLIFSVSRPFVDRSLFGLFTDILTIINALGFCFLGYIQYEIQSFQYSPRQLELHSKLAILEKKEDTQLENREIARVKVNADRRQVTKDRRDNKKS